MPRIRELSLSRSRRMKLRVGKKDTSREIDVLVVALLARDEKPYICRWTCERWSVVAVVAKIFSL